MFRFRWLGGVLVALLLFISAVQLSQWRREKDNLIHYSHYLESKNWVIAQLIEAPSEKEKSYKIEIEIEAIRQGVAWKTCIGKAMLQITKDSASAALKYGDVLLAFLPLKPIPQPQNPGEFNYARYLEFHNINYQAFLKSGNWQNLHENRGNVIYQTCLGIRDYFLGVFRENGITGDEYAVGAALILGYEDKLNPSIMSAYSASGALHVLSVSGLHLAIVFVVLDFLLKFVEKIKYGTFLKALILIFLLWVYAALTGLSPSVLRSAAMFTLIIIGRSLKRYTNIYNTLAASMFALLVWNPFLLMEVGFQLSYLAVLGIVSLQTSIYNLVEVKNKFLQQIWTISSVSIAAQISTFPLGLYYFHQFPNYFLISNLIVIPVSTVVLYLGVTICALSKLKLITWYLCKLLSGLIWFLNSSVSFFECLPHAVVQGISFSVVQTCLLYLCLLVLLLFLWNKRIVFLKTTLVAACILVFVFIIRQKEQLLQKKLIVYQIKNHSAIDFIQGKRNYFFSDSSLLQNNSSLQFHVKPNWWNMGVEFSRLENGKNLFDGFSENRIRCKSNLIVFEEKKILCINSLNTAEVAQLNLSETLDFIIVSENAKIKMDNLISKLQFKKIIFDSSNSAKKIRQWKRQCDALQIAYHDVNSQGAFVENL